MPSELEELVDFISHGNTEIRQLDLKLLVRDYKQIAKDALTILINLSADREILQELASDKEFMKTLLGRITNPSEANANEISMLLANLAKYDQLADILTIERPAPKELASNNLAVDQLLDLFVKGADGTYNKDANYDYLSYLFADLAKHSEGRQYFLTRQSYDNVVPLTKLIVFTEHKSDVRRKGVASTIKNVAFEIDSHPSILSPDEINILPYLLLPITGNEEFADDDAEGMLEDLQLLPPDKKRDADPSIVQTHVETLMLLTTTRQGRDRMREVKVYPIVREAHMSIEDDGVREACERLVQVLMRDEEGEEVDEGMKPLVRKPDRKIGHAQAMSGGGSWANQEEEDSDDDKIVEV